MQTSEGLLIVITGRITASGKDTVMHTLLARHSDLSRIITTTTREPREGEQDNKDYFFKTRKEFLAMKDAGELAEDIEFAGNFYGTTKKELARVLNGERLIWRIDPSMACKVDSFIREVFDGNLAKSLLERLVVIFIDVPDQNTLIHRLMKNGVSQREIERRLKEDTIRSDSFNKPFDHVIVNRDGELDKTIAEVEKILNER